MTALHTDADRVVLEARLAAEVASHRASLGQAEVQQGDLQRQIELLKREREQGEHELLRERRDWADKYDALSLRANGFEDQLAAHKYRQQHTAEVLRSAC